MVHFVLVWKSSKYSCLSSFPSKQSFNNRKLRPRDKQDDSIKTTSFTSSKQFEETWKLEAGVMCRKNLNLQGRKSFYEDIHVRKFKASDLLPSHLLYLPHCGSHPNLNMVCSLRLGQSRGRRRTKRHCTLGLARKNEWHQSYCDRFTGQKKNVFGHQSVTRSGSFVNTLEVKRRQISGDLNIEILDFSSFDSITPQY